MLNIFISYIIPSPNRFSFILLGSVHSVFISTLFSLIPRIILLNKILLLMYLPYSHTCCMFQFYCQYVHVRVFSFQKIFFPYFLLQFCYLCIFSICLTFLFFRFTRVLRALCVPQSVFMLLYDGYFSEL